LQEDGNVPINGRTVLFTLGSGGTAQTCSAPTDTTGRAACTINPVNQPLGPETATAAFAGDFFYRSSSATGAVIIFQPGGAFAISAHGLLTVPRTPNVVCPPGGNVTNATVNTPLGTIYGFNASCSTNPTDGTTTPASSIQTARLFGGALVISNIQSSCSAGPAGIFCTSSVGSVNGIPIGTASVTLNILGTLVTINETSSNGPGRPIRNAVHIKLLGEEIILAESYFI
jgi:hypothetical protein